MELKMKMKKRKVPRQRIRSNKNTTWHQSKSGVVAILVTAGPTTPLYISF